MQYILTVVVTRVCACIFTSLYRLFYLFTHFWRSQKSHDEWLNVYCVCRVVCDIFLSFCFSSLVLYDLVVFIFAFAYVLVSSSPQNDELFTFFSSYFLQNFLLVYFFEFIFRYAIWMVDWLDGC